MNRHLTGILTLALLSSGGIYLATRQPATPLPVANLSPQPKESPTPATLLAVPEQTTPQTASISPKADALLQAPDAAPLAPVPPVNYTLRKPASPNGSASPYAKIVIPAGQPVPELFPYQSERDEISRLASTYDAKQIPAIAAYLGHKDATVRDAARLGLVQLGEEKAVPILKEAAKKAATPEEATLLNESAEFLALPSFVDVMFPHNGSSKS